MEYKIENVCNDTNSFFSRKNIKEENLKNVINNLKEGQIVSGIVKNIRRYGVFVEICLGVVGLLHIEDISVSRIKSPEERFFVGQKINVMIKYVDRKESRIVLTHKELWGTWEDNVKDFSEGMKVQGIVRENDKYRNGIFIELRPNLVGMAEFKDGYQYGQTVDVYIKKIIDDKKKIKLVII